MENFIFLNKEKLEKEKQEFEKEIEVRKIMSSLIMELSKIGHKKITKRVTEYTIKFLNDKNIKYNYVYYSVHDMKFGDSKYLDRKLIINFIDYKGYSGYINIINNYDYAINKTGEGYYDNLLNNNIGLSIENLKNFETEKKQQFESAFLKLEDYNKKLKELVELRDEFGYLAK